jgi:hypothetical protein
MKISYADEVKDAGKAPEKRMSKVKVEVPVSKVKKPKIEREITDKKYNHISILPILKSEAPGGKYVYHQLPNHWGVINSYFWNKLNLKMHECMEKEKTVVPALEKVAVESPKVEEPWYKDPEIIVYGIPVSLSIGAVIGYILSK